MVPPPASPRALRRVGLLLLGAGALLALAGAAQGAVQVVTIHSTAEDGVSPNPVLLRPGDSIVWRNTDVSRHTSTEGHPEDTQHDWNYAMQPTQSSPPRTFPESGEWRYYCATAGHADLFGMRNFRIVVNLPPTSAFSYSPIDPVANETVVFAAVVDDPDDNVASVNWNFGDGGTATGMEATHAFAAPGNYTVQLAVHDLEGRFTVEQVVEVFPPDESPPPPPGQVNHPPTADFTSNASSPYRGSRVLFTWTGSDPDPGDRAVRWTWDFGDGGTGSGRSVLHAFGRVGRHTVTLTVADLFNATASFQAVFDVLGRPPVVALGANASGGPAPLALTFTTVARDPDGQVRNWTFDPGDGSDPVEGAGSPNGTRRHIYERAGIFVASLAATDDDGNVQRAFHRVEVEAAAAPPTALPPGAIAVAPAGNRLTYRFTATTTLDGDVAYHWDFGDGRTGAGREVVYSYASAGTYTVTLSVMEGGRAVARGTTTLQAMEESVAPRERVRAEAHDGVVRVLWTGDVRASGYQVWRSEEGGRFEEAAVVQAAESYDDLDLRDGASYAYRVTFFGPGNEGRLLRLSQLNLTTQAFRLLGEAAATATVDRDGDGVRDRLDGAPDDPSRANGVPSPAAALGASLAALAALLRRRSRGA